MTDSFRVVVQLMSVHMGDGLITARGLDSEGYEVVWTDKPWHFDQMLSMIGEEVIVLGYEIIGYSGEYGPWGSAAVPQKGDDA